MDNRIDIILDEDNDVYAKDGDFVLGVSDNQHVQHILQAMPGEYKQSPLTGVGLPQMRKATLDADTKRLINLGLADDGYITREVKLENDKLIINV